MKKKILTHSFLLLFVAFGFISCDKSQIFDEYHTFDAGWKKNSIINFSFTQNASRTPRNLFVNIRDNNDYEFSNLFLIVKLEEPDGLTKIDTLEYQMANPDGELQGNLLGNGFSDIKESKLWYKENKIFTKTGKYKVSIQQAVRKSGKVKGIEILNGITDIGFRIESLEKQE
jgi:gliding motility-associated lipoprotein GldH